jgi:hypothetical protein
LVDRVIDSCACSFIIIITFWVTQRLDFLFWPWAGDHVRNLREDILIHRLNYSLTTMDTDEGLREEYLDKAVQALEK